MVTQKAISLKIDTMLLEELDKEVALGYQKRNAIINIAIRQYLELVDVRRMARTYAAYGDDKEKDAHINKWLRRRFPEAAR